MYKHNDEITKILKFCGLAGVDDDENEQAHFWGTFFAWPMLVMAFWLLAQWILIAHGTISLHLANVLGWIIWSAFVLETAVLTAVVDNKVRYLKHNWMNFCIIVSAFPAIWGHTPITVIIRMLRVIIIPRMLINWWRR